MPNSNRLAAALATGSIPKRDEVLAALAKDAAAEGDAAMTKLALSNTVSFSMRDRAAREAARLLARRGMRVEALDLVGLITSPSQRRQALQELNR